MCRYNEMTDEALIERLRAGESAIADYLMEKYKGLVRKKARAMFLIGGDTDDLIQEGMIGLFKAVRDYQPDRESSFQSFANICIDRQIYTAIKSSNRQKHQPLNTYVSLSDGEAEENFRDSCVEHDNPESILIDRENVAALENEMKKSLSLWKTGYCSCIWMEMDIWILPRSLEKHRNPLIMHCRGSVGKLKAIFEKSKYLFPFEYKSIKIIFIRSRIRKETKLWQRSINIGDLLQ